MKFSRTLRVLFLGPFAVIALLIFARTLGLTPTVPISSPNYGLWLTCLAVLVEFFAVAVAVWQLCRNPALRIGRNFAYLALGLTPLVLAVLLVWGLAHIQG